MKRVSLLLTMLLLLTTGTALAGRSFSDVSSSDWYYTDLMEIANDARGILDGYPDGTYRPDVDLQVDQFIKTVVKASGYDVANAEGYWAQSHIDQAIKEGFIVEGDFSDYRRVITREEMASIVVKVMEKMDKPSYSKSNEVEEALYDSSSISMENKSDVLKVYELGIITGYPDGTFRPKNTLPRREAAVVLRRIIDVSARKPFESMVTSEVVYEDHYVGGSQWVNPVTATDEENVAEDLLMIESGELFYDDGGNYEWDDQLTVIVTFVNASDVPDSQIEDIERLLLRRIREDDVNEIMSYIKQKESWQELLPNKVYSSQREGYKIEIKEEIIYPGTRFEMAKKIAIQMWYEE